VQAVPQAHQRLSSGQRLLSLGSNGTRRLQLPCHLLLQRRHLLLQLLLALQGVSQLLPSRQLRIMQLKLKLCHLLEVLLAGPSLPL
jgi:hypothetical protein